MNSNLKIGLAFVAGGVLMNAGVAFSNAPSTQDMLADAMSMAINKANEAAEQREDARLEKMPNIMDCQKMTWMQSCSELNKQAKKNPDAPIRVQNPKGIEFNFTPGTPSAVIRLQLEQTPEAAAAMVEYMDSTWGEYKKSAALYQMATWKKGELKNIKGLDFAQKEAAAVKPISTQDLSVSVFVESTCSVCERQLSTLSLLQKKYPQLKIRIFQLDNTPAAFNRNVLERGLTGRILTKDEVLNVRAQGITKWPITWVDNLPTKKRATVVGNRTLPQLETKLMAMSNAAPINLAKK